MGLRGNTRAGDGVDTVARFIGRQGGVARG